MQERLRQERIRNRLGGKGCQLSRWQAEYFLATKNKPVIGSGLRSALCPAGLYALSFSRSMHNIKAGTPHHWTPDPGISDRKSTRLNSSHLGISYAVFCLKK